MRTKGLERIATASLIVILSIASLVLASLPFSNRTQDAFFADHHLITDGACWPLIRLLPKMYGFAHTAQISDAPAGGAFGMEGPRRAFVFRVNHFPSHIAQFGHWRVVMAGNIKPRLLVITSRYRGRSLTSAYMVGPNGMALKVDPAPVPADQSDLP